MKLKLLLSLIISFCLVSCSDDDGPEVKKESSRTLLVYMVSDNSLYSFGESDLKEMLTAARNGGLKNDGRLLVYYASGVTPELREITPDGIVTLKTYDDVTSSVTVSTMRRVMADMHQLAPANDYALVMWSHSSGWLKPSVSAPQNRSWGVENSTGGAEMSIPELADALRGEHFSFMYFDCCYMGNIETLYELRGITDYVVASPTEFPSDGMPYNLNVGCFFELVPDLKGAARNTFDYYDVQSGKYRSCTISVYDMSKIDRVAKATRNIMLENLILPADYTPQGYGVGNKFRDKYYDLGYYALSLTDNASLQSEFQSAMDDFVIYKEATDYMWDSLKLEHCSGVSSYIVKADDEGISKADNYGYFDLEWSDDVVIPAFSAHSLM